MLKLNPTTGLLDLVDSSGGGGATDHGALTGLTDDDHPQYLLLAGRTGTTNDYVLSLDADGTGRGSDTPGFTYHLGSDDGTPGLHIQRNALSFDRLIIGLNVDPTDSIVPGGVLQFLVSADGTSGRFGAATFSDSGADGSEFFGIRGRSTVAAPTASEDGDTLFTIFVFGYDDNNDLAITGPAFGLQVLQKGSRSDNTVPGVVSFNTTDSTGAPSTKLGIDVDGNVGVGVGLNPFGGFTHNLMVVGTVAAGATSTEFQIDADGDATLHSVPYTWPLAQGAALTFLQNNGAGTLSWATASGAGLVSGTGVAGRIAIWTGASTISSDAELLYDSTTNTLTVTGAAVITGKLTVGGDIDPTRVLLSGGDKRFGATDAGTIYLAPFTNSTTAVQVRAADNTTPTATFDTTNRQMGVGADGGLNFTLDVVSSVSGNTGITTYSSAAATVSSSVIIGRARGSQSVPAQTLSGDRLGELRFVGYDGANFDVIGAGLRGTAAENVAAGAAGTHLDVITTPIGSTTAAVRGRWTSAGLLGIGTIIPGVPLDVVGATTTNASFGSILYSATAADTTRIRLARARGTEALPTAISSGDFLSTIASFGHDGTNFGSMATYIRAVATQAFAVGAHGARLDFATQTNGGDAGSTVRLTIDNDGTVVVANLAGAGTRFVTASATGLLATATTATPSAHNFLDSTVHNNTLTGTPTRGDLIVANSTPAWAKFAIGGSGTFLRAGATDPAWAALVDADIPDTLTLTNVTGGTTFSANVVTTTTLTVGTIIGSYNGVATVGGGVLSLVATVDLTAQAAAVATATLYAVPAAKGGLYRINWYLKITQAATTSSTLGALTVGWTDATDATAQSMLAAGNQSLGTVAATAVTNTTTTKITGDSTVWAAASTNITYAIAYASSGGTPMQYEFHAKVVALL